MTKKTLETIASILKDRSKDVNTANEEMVQVILSDPQNIIDQRTEEWAREYLLVLLRLLANNLMQRIYLGR